MNLPPSISPTELVEAINLTLEQTLPMILVEGELANLKISRNKWLHFDLKDERSSVRFFGTVFQQPGKLEDGQVLRVLGVPRLSNLYGFSINIQAIEFSGEGTIRAAFEKLKRQLDAEGLFDDSRKRKLPDFPQKIGLIASKESAAYPDFIKILNTRWRGVEVLHIDTLVQGIEAPDQIIEALEHLNSLPILPETIVVTRGGGSSDDLQAFNNEQLVRKISVSRVPTLLAIGHEIDLTLAELVADVRGSTPSNAAEILFPSATEWYQKLNQTQRSIYDHIVHNIKLKTQEIKGVNKLLQAGLHNILMHQEATLLHMSQLVSAYSPLINLKRGYTITMQNDKIVKSAKLIKSGTINTHWFDGEIKSIVSEL